MKRQLIMDFRFKVAALKTHLRQTGDKLTPEQIDEILDLINKYQDYIDKLEKLPD